jgi:PKD repeat protein
MGLAFFNMLVQKKVDLIIQAHDNAYERSKQLAFNPTTCPKMAGDGNGYVVYNSGCIADSGLGNYTRGVGSVVVVQGAWVNDLYGVGANATSTQTIAEAPYFAKLMGKGTAGSGLGFTKYVVSPNRIDIQTYFSGTFQDKFSLTTGLNPVPYATWSPQVPQIGQTVTFTGTATGGTAPYSFSWTFGDGSKATGATVNHSYTSTNYFNVTLTVVDSANRTGSYRSIIALGSWNSAVPCSPTQSTIEKVVGKVTIQRTATDPSSVGADYSGGGFKLAGTQPFGSSPSNWPFSKRSLQPPCFINGIPTFVELHNVTLTAPPAVATYDCRTSYDQSNGAALFPNGKNCDVVFSIGNASATSCPSCYVHRIYAEIDGDWNASGAAPLIPPNPGQLIDVQGFVYWDADSLNFSSHNWSGWELHPFTAWRPAQNRTSPPTVTVAALTPNPANTGTTVTVSYTVSSSATVTGVIVNWGDGTASDNLPSIARSDTHVYASSGFARSQTFTITVTAANSAGPGSGTTTETVNDRPPMVTLSSIAPNPANTTSTVTATFSGTDPDGTVSSFTVNWGDSSTPDNLPANATSDTHSYLSAGSFTVTITATDNSGSTGQGTGSITVQTPAVPTVTVNAPTPNPASTGATVTVTFTISSSTKVTGITVDWGDGTAPDNLGEKATPDTHTYVTTGSLRSQTFTITITASNGAGASSGTTSETINDRPPTITISSVAPNPASTGSAVTVGIASTDPDGTVSSISVDWGDGTTPSSLSGTATSATHNFANTGGATSQTFIIRIIVTDNSGSLGQATSSVTINDRPPAVSIAGLSPNPVNTGQLVTLTFSTTDPDGTVSSVTVSWGDGTTPSSLAGTVTSATHTYASTGPSTSKSFTVTVSAVDNGGSTSSASTSEAVNDRPPATTVSGISPNPALIGQTVTVTFSATDPDGTISSFSVDWGDGTAFDTLPGTATSDTHAYGSGGSFTITVNARDNSGSAGSGTISETVSAPLAPTVNVTSVTPDPVNTGATVTVTFTVSSTLPVTSITVNWGDGTTPDGLAATATSDTHVYASTGDSKSRNFTITVSANNSAGTGSGSIQETVNDRGPTVTITGVSPNPSNTGSIITATFTSSDVDGTVLGITVNWGDGTAVDNLPVTATSDTHTYASTGASTSKSFTIILTATDNSASAGSAIAAEIVNDRPPTATLTNVSPNPANTGQLVTVTFTASDADGTISSISVSWGDGSAADFLAGTATTDTHTYTSGNNFTITMACTDNSGSTGQSIGSVTVTVPASTPYALVTSADGRVFKLYANGTMTFVGQPVTTVLRQVAWKPDGSYALISGDSAVLLKYNGTQLTTLPTGVSTGLNFWTVSWKPDGSYALIGGTSGLLLKYDGDKVTAITDPYTSTIFSISWHPSGTYALLVGKSGLTLTYDGTTVRKFVAMTPYDLNTAAWNPSGQYALIGGVNGTLVRFDGTQAVTINTTGFTGTNGIHSIAFNSAGSLALLVGDNGMVLTYNGSTLSLLPRVNYSWLYSISWSPTGTAYIVGNGGTCLTYSNATVAKLTTNPINTSQLRAIAWKP